MDPRFSSGARAEAIRFAPVVYDNVDLTSQEIRNKVSVEGKRTSGKSPPGAKAPRAARNCGPVISGGIVPPGTLAPNASHPLRHVPPHRRAELALKALGLLVLHVAQPPSTGFNSTVNHDAPLNGERPSSTATNDKE